MRTTYIRVSMRKSSINNVIIHAHKIYYCSHAQEFYKQWFCLYAQIILEFPCAGIL